MSQTTNQKNYSQRIAAVLGPALVVTNVSETIHLDIWEDVDPPLVYLNGLLFFVGGLFIATTHNLWVRDWRVLVTLSGWLLMLAGAYRMFAPKAPQLDPGPVTYAGIALLGCLGATLSWFGFVKR